MAENEIQEMSPQVKSLAGQKFGRLTVLRYAGITPDHHARWECVCDCPAKGIKIVTTGKLRRGHVRSCGCLERESRGLHWKTHGMSRTPEHWCWFSMKQRCLNPKADNYADYGGRGIKVCDRWIASFEAFYEDMGKKPSPKHSIDRKDVNGPYDKENCRWATKKEQSRNRRNTRPIPFGDESLTIAEWAERIGCDGQVISKRLQSGWSVERALTTPLRPWPPKHKHREPQTSVSC